METAEWFACLNYGKIEFLIPQYLILESNYTTRDRELKGLETFSLDDFASEILKVEIKREVSRTHLLIKQRPVPFEMVTSSVPEVLSIEYGSFRLLKGEVGKHLAEKGIIGFRTVKTAEGERMQYIADPCVLMSGQEKT